MASRACGELLELGALVPIFSESGACHRARAARSVPLLERRHGPRKGRRGARRARRVDESRAGVHDDLMRVPGKPLGFLAASTIEYHPARPEAHRSTVLAGQKLHSSRPPKPRELPVKVSLRHK